jgi:hypothetical protein
MCDELGIDDVPAQGTARPAAVFAPFGTPITVEEVQKRLSKNLYDQLSEKSEDTVANAVSRAEVYAGAILSFLKVPFNLDDTVIREIVLMQTVYELHMALGHEEAGREYRIQAKNTIVAAFGSFPDADSAGSVPPRLPAAAVVKPAQRGRNYNRALP